MGQRMQQDVPHGRVAFVGLQTTGRAPAPVGLEELAVTALRSSSATLRLPPRRTGGRRPRPGLSEVGTHFGAERPSGTRCSSGKSAEFGVVAGGFDAGEADQRPHLSEPFRQHHLRQHVAVLLRGFDDPELEIPAVQARVGVREDLPLGVTQVGGVLIVLTRPGLLLRRPPPRSALR